MLLKIEAIKQVTLSNESLISNYWFWISFLELIIIILLIISRRNRSSDLNEDKIKSMKNAKVDMAGLMNSINSSKELYKELSKKCHPDRFVNTDKQEIADLLFQEITQSKRDFGALEKLKIRAEKELGIKF
jgi:hypothetical protein